MASIGVQPTRTNVRITSDTGAHGTIEPATGTQAGCMTATHARQLDELVAWRRTAEIAPQAAALVHTPVSLQAIRDAASALSATSQLLNEPAPPVVVDREPELLVLRNELAHQAGFIEALEATVSRLMQQHEALSQRIVAIEQVPQPVAPGFHDDEPLPSFLGGAAPAPSRPVPDPAHDYNNLRAEMDALSGYVRKLAETPAPIPVTPEPEPPKVDPRAAAVEAVRRAADERRRKAMVGGDPILAIKLAEVAHLARAGQEGPITLMATIAEAVGSGAWQEAASDLVVQADSLSRVCVRTYAVETAAISEIEQASGDMIEKIASGATAAIAAIQG